MSPFDSYYEGLLFSSLSFWSRYGGTDKLTALLQEFLGSMGQSSAAYQNWHAMLRKYFNTSGFRGSQFSHQLPLYNVYESLSPYSRASLAIMRFGFYKNIRDWWTVGFAYINEEISSGDSLLLLGARSV